MQKKVYVKEYNDLMNNNLIKEFHTTKLPHLVFNHKWYQQFKNNIVMLKSPEEIMVDFKQQMHYKIDFFGSKVEYTRKGKFWILHPSSTPANTIFVIVRLRDIYHIPRVQYHTEFGEMISKYNLDKGREHCYELLSLIYIEKNIRNLCALFNLKIYHL